MTETLPELADLLAVVVPGTPQSQGSKRVVSSGGRYRAIESNKRLRPWRAEALAAIRDALPEGWLPLDGPVSVSAEFVFARPSSHYGTGRNIGKLRPSAPAWKASAPDVDKLARALFDALTDAGVVRDDSRIVAGRLAKLWGPIAETRVSIGRPA